MAVFGVIAIIMSFMNRVPSLLMWIYNWGEITAWGIKIGFVVIGVILYFMGNQDIIDDEQQSNISE